jgi:hypothetical protein
VSNEYARVGTELRARLNSMNNSGAEGSAEVTVRHRRLTVDVDVRRVLANQPHAMHIHFGKKARHECPTVARDDHNGDFRIETAEGLPAYGPVRVSFTTRGPTGKGSVLAVNRFPTAPRGQIHYDRHMKASATAMRSWSSTVSTTTATASTTSAEADAATSTRNCRRRPLTQQLAESCGTDRLRNRATEQSTRQWRGISTRSGATAALASWPC